MTPLRQRMIEDMQIRNLASTTQKTYVGEVARFALHFGKSPEFLGADEIREYQIYLLKERAMSPASLVKVVAALRFLYGRTLQQPWTIEAIPSPKVAKKLPTVLSRDEVVTCLSLTNSLKHRALLMFFYGCGLRLSETIHLRVEDIDSEQMLVRVAHGKGDRQRLVPLPQSLLEVLREYWKECRPKDWLFPGQVPGRPLTGSVARLVSRNASIPIACGTASRPIYSKVLICG